MAPEPKLAEAVTDRNPGSTAPRSNERLAEAFGQWLRVLNRARSTVYTQARTVRKFSASLSGRSLLDVDRHDIRSFLASCPTVYSRAHALYALRNFYRFLNLGGLTCLNPAREVCLPKLPEPIPRVPTVEEVERLLQAVEDAANGEEG